MHKSAETLVEAERDLYHESGHLAEREADELPPGRPLDLRLELAALEIDANAILGAHMSCNPAPTDPLEVRIEGLEIRLEETRRELTGLRKLLQDHCII